MWIKLIQACTKTSQSADVGPFRRRLASSPTQHQEGTSGVGADREVSTERGGGAGSLGKQLLPSNSGGALFWSGYMGVFGNDEEVRGSACGFPTTGHTKKVRAADG